jgi:hypothetical protein
MSTQKHGVETNERLGLRKKDPTASALPEKEKERWSLSSISAYL